MNSNPLNQRNKNISSLSTTPNSAGKNNNNFSSSKKVNNNNILNSNKKALANSNSKTNLNSKKNSIIIKSDLIDIDNIDESAYNPDPFALPKKKFEHNLYTSNIEKTVQNYNIIKENVNKKISNSKIPEDVAALQSKNFALLEQLDKLNSILDTIVEKKNFAKKKNTNINSNKNNLKNKELSSNKMTSKEINNKLLQSYIKQYNLLNTRYQKISQEDYIPDLKQNVELLTLEISNLEKENRQLRTDQFKSEYFLKNQYSSQSELNYRKKVEEYDKLNNEYTKIMQTIPKKEDSSRNNEMKIEQLNENKQNLIKIAKEMYNINNPEEKMNKKKRKEKMIMLLLIIIMK